MRGQPPEVLLHIGRILEWFNHNDQERTFVERAFWECFQAELVLVGGQRLQPGDPRGLKDFRVSRDVPFKGRTRTNYLVVELREMLRLSQQSQPEEKPEADGLRTRRAASA
jgi:hypothetical protein